MTEIRTINLSDRKLNNNEINLLEKGLSFIPTPHRLPVSNIIYNRDRLIRDIKIKSYFKCNNNNNNKKNSTQTYDYKKIKFTEKSTWSPPLIKLKENTLSTVNSICNITTDFLTNNKIDTNRVGDMFVRTDEQDNLSQAERSALRALQNDKTIVIKPFDKGGGTVIINKVDYIKEAMRQLEDTKYYKKIPHTLTTSTTTAIRKILGEMLDSNFINKKQFEFLTGPKERKTRTFYLLPKVHKPKHKWPSPRMPEGRPIVSDVNSESYRVANFIESFLKNLANKHPSYIKNSYEFVKKIRNLRVSKNSFIVTADVSALYTNMHFERSLDVVRRAFRENPDPKRSDKHILDLLEITLKCNDFEFNNNIYLQTLGTAMGKIYAPSLANLYLLDLDYLATHNFKIKPKFFFRYLDDLFFIWEGTIEELKEYEIYLNNLIPDIKLTMTSSMESNNFLDVLIYKSQTQEGDYSLQTKVFFKETDTHQLLRRDSFHPTHTFRGILKAQFIRFRRLSTTDKDYLDTSKEFISFLLDRGYTRTMSKKIMWDVFYNYTDTGTENRNNSDNKGTMSDSGNLQKKDIFPIVSEYCRKTKYLITEYKNELLKNTDFNNFSFLSAFKANPNLKNLLVRSKLQTDYKGKFSKCLTRRCVTCKYAAETDTFGGVHRSDKYPIKYDLDCRSSNVIYMIICNKCNLQYIGETGRTLGLRFRDHLYAIRHNTPTPIGSHFNQTGHTLQDVSVLAIDSLYQVSGSPEMRKNLEKQWQNKLQTIHPRGLNNIIQ